MGMKKYLRLVNLIISRINKTKRNDEHPLQPLIGAGERNYDDFDLEKEREEMWPR
jgi:hypothetical protein